MDGSFYSWMVFTPSRMYTVVFPETGHRLGWSGRVDGGREGLSGWAGDGPYGPLKQPQAQLQLEDDLGPATTNTTWDLGPLHLCRSVWGG